MIRRAAVVDDENLDRGRCEDSFTGPPPRGRAQWNELINKLKRYHCLGENVDYEELRNAFKMPSRGTAYSQQRENFKEFEVEFQNSSSNAQFEILSTISKRGMNFSEDIYWFKYLRDSPTDFNPNIVHVFTFHARIPGETVQEDDNDYFYLELDHEEKDWNVNSDIYLSETVNEEYVVARFKMAFRNTTMSVVEKAEEIKIETTWDVISGRVRSDFFSKHLNGEQYSSIKTISLPDAQRKTIISNVFSYKAWLGFNGYSYKTLEKIRGDSEYICKRISDFTISKFQFKDKNIDVTPYLMQKFTENSTEFSVDLFTTKTKIRVDCSIVSDKEIDPKFLGYIHPDISYQISRTIHGVETRIPTIIRARFRGKNGYLLTCPMLSTKKIVFPDYLTSYQSVIQNDSIYVREVSFCNEEKNSYITPNNILAICGCDPTLATEERIQSQLVSSLSTLIETYSIERAIERIDIPALSVFTATKDIHLSLLSSDEFLNKVLKMNMPFKNCNRFLAMHDPYDVLEKEHVFIQTVIDSKLEILTGNVMIVRDNSLHRSDLKKRVAINHEKLVEFENVIVFSKEDTIPTQECLFTCWDEDIVNPLLEFRETTECIYRSPILSVENKFWIAFRDSFADFYGSEWTNDKNWELIESIFKIITQSESKEATPEILDKFPGFPHYFYPNEFEDHASILSDLPTRKSTSIIGRCFDSLLNTVSEMMKLPFKVLDYSIILDRFASYIQADAYFKNEADYVAAQLGKIRETYHPRYCADFLHLYSDVIGMSKGLQLVCVERELVHEYIRANKLTKEFLEANYCVILRRDIIKHQLEKYASSKQVLESGFKQLSFSNTKYHLIQQKVRSLIKKYAPSL